MTLLSSCTSKIGSGVTPRGGDSVYVPEGVALIRSQNVYNGEFSQDGLAHITDKQAEQMNGVSVLPEDVLLNITGDSVARCTIAPIEVLPARVNQHVSIIRPDRKKLLPKYLMYFLVSPAMQAYMLSIAGSGGTRNALTKGMIEKFDVPTPPITEQQRVVDILSAYDDLIENNRRRIKLLEDAASLLYREWFVHLRFPGHEHVKVVDGVPEGWSRISLGELLTLQRGFDLPASARVEGGYPVYAATGIHGRHNKAMVKGPGVITGRSGSLGKVLYSPDDFWPLNTTLWVKDFKLVSPEFAFFLLSGLNLEQFNGGAAVPTLNRNDVHRIEVRLPPQRLIEEFSEIVLVQLRQIEGLIRFNAKLCEARDLLLPRLMSGELAV